MSLDGPSGVATLVDRGISVVEVEAGEPKQSVMVAGAVGNVDSVGAHPCDNLELPVPTAECTLLGFPVRTRCYPPVLGLTWHAVSISSIGKVSGGGRTMVPCKPLSGRRRFRGAARPSCRWLRTVQ